MKRRTKILMGLAIAAVVVALATPAAFAQCPQAREFAMTLNGMTHGRIGVDPINNLGGGDIVTNNNATQVGSFWETGNSAATNSGGPHFAGPDTCQSNQWWIVSSPGGTGGTGSHSIAGFMSTGVCTMTACPLAGSSLSVVVEDVNAAGDEAGFIVYTADETPSPIRWWDLARTDAATQPSNDVTHSLRAFPHVEVQASAGPPPTTTLTNTYRNVDINLHGVGGAGSPAQQVTSYEIFAVHAAAAPGRARSNWGLPLKTIAYPGAGGPLPDSLLVPCPTTTDDTFVAVGMVYDGNVNSFYVGAATVVECDPSIADPDGPSELRRKSPRSLKRGGR